MGGNNAKVYQDILQKQTTSRTLSFVQDITNDNVQNINNKQSVSIDVSDNATISCDGDFKITNFGETDQRGISRIDAGQISDINLDIEANFTSSVESLLEQLKKDFGLGGDNDADLLQSITQEIRDETEARIEQALRNNVSFSTELTQSIDVKVTENGAILVGGDCVFTNELSVTMSTDSMVQAYQDVFYEQESVATFAAELESVIDQKNEGTNITLILILIAVIILLAIIGGVVGKVVHDKKKK